LAIEARRRRIDVVHHGGGVLPLWAPAATVVTIHDLQPLDLAEAFSPLKRRWLGLMLPRAAHRADLVVTTSEFVRRGVIDRFAIPSTRVRLVPPCLVGTLPTTTPARPTPACLEPLRRRWDIGERYVVYPAITYPHKNHAVLAEAVAAAAWPTDLHLVLPGGEASGEQRLVTRLAALPPDRRRLVHRLGRIPRNELDALIAEARAVAFPSRYEGFGIPVLEALDAGTPVVAAEAGALPEVVGTAGRLLDPGDPGAWATTLADVASAPPRQRRRMAAAARARAADFSPTRTGAALIDAWQRVARPARRRASPATAGGSAP
jgi:alpha-1,3-rhamnosyl/mannosyltransferase